MNGFDNATPPPVISSARTSWFAKVDDDVDYTGSIRLFVDGERLGKVQRLVIALNYCVPHDCLLLFCDAEWSCQGVIACDSIADAKEQAEAGYRGLRWHADTHSDEQVDRFLRDIYSVDPATAWWRSDCSFCGKGLGEVSGLLASTHARICHECVRTFAASID